jgi:hypothetical protein
MPFWACVPQLFIAPALKNGTGKMQQKMLHLDAPSTPGVFDRHERAALILANKLATDPQSYSNQDFAGSAPLSVNMTRTSMRP